MDIENIEFEYTKNRIDEILREVKLMYISLQRKNSDSAILKLFKSCLDAITLGNIEKFREEFVMLTDSLLDLKENNGDDLIYKYIGTALSGFNMIINGPIQYMIESKFYTMGTPTGFYLFIKKNDGQIINDVIDFNPLDLKILNQELMRIVSTMVTEILGVKFSLNALSGIK